MLAAAALVFLASCAAAGSTGGAVDVREVANDALGAAETMQAVAAFDAATYRERWASLISRDEAPPAIDFNTESAVFLTAGTRPTGGWQIVVHGASIEGETLVVEATVEGPPGGAMAAQMLTYPYAVIAVKSRAFKEVRWSALKK